MSSRLSNGEGEIKVAFDSIEGTQEREHVTKLHEIARDEQSVTIWAKKIERVMEDAKALDIHLNLSALDPHDLDDISRTLNNLIGKLIKGEEALETQVHRRGFVVDHSDEGRVKPKSEIKK